MDTLSLANLAVGVLIPIAVAFVTKEVTGSGVKAITLAALAAVSGVLMNYIDVGSITEDSVTQAVTNFIIAVATYYGLWKPTGTTGTIQTKTSEIGL